MGEELVQKDLLQSRRPDGLVVSRRENPMGPDTKNPDMLVLIQACCNNQKNFYWGKVVGCIVGHDDDDDDDGDDDDDDSGDVDYDEDRVCKMMLFI